MSWTYSGNPADSRKDALRFLIGDTIEAEPVLQDEEIEFLIVEYGSNENLLRYEMFNRAATQLARDYKRSLGSQHDDPTKRDEYFAEQARYYKTKLTKLGISIPNYSHPKVFRVGMQNNPPWPGSEV